jgi:hypothetical protein
VIVAIVNVGMLVWLVAQFFSEYAHEQKEEAAKKGGEGSTLVKMLASARHSIQRWRFNRMTPDEQQRAIRRRTTEAKDSNITDNPVTIEMSEVEIKVNAGKAQGLAYENPNIKIEK